MLISQWILDIGATYHICNSINSFIIYSGSLVVTFVFGTVPFSPNFILTNDLFWPSFKFNLVLVTKLTQILHYKLIFLGEICLIQDSNACKMIGKLRREEASTFSHQQLSLLRQQLVTPRIPILLPTSSLKIFLVVFLLTYKSYGIIGYAIHQVQ